MQRILHQSYKRCRVPQVRSFQTISPHLRENHAPFTNILASEVPPPVQVSQITPEGIHLADGLIIPSACIFLEGKVFLWDVPQSLWNGWSKDRFEIFETVVPKPVILDILLLGTGFSASMPPPSIRMFLNDMGIQTDVMDTR
ncbi:hypothetical protein NEOLEDRAFT_1128080, partial [Neolentinus lepideus HHB14362 ss-1]